MSDADDQMGGTGGETGPPPQPGKGQSGEKQDDAVTEESQESFPASDPPANY